MESSPYYRVIIDDDLFVLRWDTSTHEALVELGARIRARHGELGAKIYYIGVIPSALPMPDPELREAIIESSTQMAPLLSANRLVILGAGFQATLIRSALTAMTLIAGMRGNPLYLDKTLRLSIERYAARAQRPAEPLLERVVSEGLATRAELDNA